MQPLSPAVATPPSGSCPPQDRSGRSPRSGREAGANRSLSAGAARPATHRVALKVWLADVIDLQGMVNLLDQQLAAMRQRRTLKQQIQRVTRIDPLGSRQDLATALIKDNRQSLREERTLSDHRRHCAAELVCARDILSPRALLEQARREWADLPSRGPAGPDTPLADAWLHRKREAVIVRLAELIGALHPGVCMPDVSSWMEQRMDELHRRETGPSQRLEGAGDQ